MVNHSFLFLVFTRGLSFAHAPEFCILFCVTIGGSLMLVSFIKTGSFHKSSSDSSSEESSCFDHVCNA